MLFGFENFFQMSLMSCVGQLPQEKELHYFFVSYQPILVFLENFLMGKFRYSILRKKSEEQISQTSLLSAFFFYCLVIGRNSKIFFVF